MEHQGSVLDLCLLNLLLLIMSILLLTLELHVVVLYLLPLLPHQHTMQELLDIVGGDHRLMGVERRMQLEGLRIA